MGSSEEKGMCTSELGFGFGLGFGLELGLGLGARLRVKEVEFRQGLGLGLGLGAPSVAARRRGCARRSGGRRARPADRWTPV